MIVLNLWQYFSLVHGGTETSSGMHPSFPNRPFKVPCGFASDSMNLKSNLTFTCSVTMQKRLTMCR